ncbi:MAG: Gfo/Idh/MocA family protein, partial [Microbacterium gubbeenense]
YIAEARRLIAAGEIGEVYDFDLRVSVETPWHMFPQVFGQERLEFTMHSVHYMDLARSFFGDPDGVSAVTVRHPEKPDIATTRSSVIMRYRDRPLRVVIGTNHDHDFGPRHEESFVKWEGTRGAVRARMGLLMDYTSGVPDALEIARHGEREWTPIPFEGSWFPDAFIGSMGVLQRFVAGRSPSCRRRWTTFCAPWRSWRPPTAPTRPRAWCRASTGVGRAQARSPVQAPEARRRRRRHASSAADSEPVGGRA